MIRNSENRTDPDGVTSLADASVSLDFYCKVEANFEVKTDKGMKEKRIEVIVFNRNFLHVSAVEGIMKGGFKGLIPDLWAVFTLNGFHLILFVALFGTILFGNSQCKTINIARDSKIEELKKVHNWEERKEVFNEGEHLTYLESFCH